MSRLQTRNNWKAGKYVSKLLEPLHTAAVFCVDFDSTHIISGSSDHTIKVWDTQTGDYLHTLRGHQYAVWCVKMLDKTDTMLSASYDSTIKYWNINSKTSIRTLEGHGSAIWALDCVGNRISSGSTDTYLRVWDLETGQCTHKILGKQDTIWCCQFVSEDVVVSGGSDVRVWDLRQCQPLANKINSTAASNQRPNPVTSMSGHADAVRCIQADEQTIVSGSYDSTAFVYDRIAGKRLFELKYHTDSITTLQYDQYGMLITSSFDHTFVNWDMNTGEKITSWGHSKDDNRKLATIRYDDEDDPKHGGKVYSIAFDESKLVSAREDCRLCVYDFGFTKNKD